jgi:hypothetical protein
LEEELQKIISPDGFAIVCGSRAHLGKACFFSIMTWDAQGPGSTNIKRLFKALGLSKKVKKM